MESQVQIVRAKLERGEVLSSQDTWRTQDEQGNTVYITRLSAVIWALRHRHGMNIVSVWVRGTDLRGLPTRYVKYRLAE